MPARLLVVGPSVSPTGFARVTAALLPRLSEHYELHHFAIDQALLATATPWHTHSNRENGLDPFGGDRLAAVVRAVQPEVVLVVGEICSTVRHYPFLLGPGRPFRTLLYAAVASTQDLRREWLARLRTLDALVLFTHFARSLAQEALHDHGRGADTPSLHVIPHGVDPLHFHPLPDKVAARAQLLGGSSNPERAFIVLNANRNQPNKRIDLCLAGFARFAADKNPHVRLLLHMGSAPARPGQSSLVDRYGLRPRVLVTSKDSRHPHVTTAQLNLLFNACDIGINTARAEGWGLLAFEHAATEAAQIVPGFGATEELWRGSAVLLPARSNPTTTTPSAPRSDEVEDVAMALQRLYEQPRLRSEISRACNRNATQKARQWEFIANAWLGLIESVLAAKPSESALASDQSARTNHSAEL